jgi:hypothetical protein
MSVRCSQCGEELMGAVNRCWKCGQQFAARPTVDGLPPVRPEYEAVAVELSHEPLEARVLEDDAAIAAAEMQFLASGTSTVTAEPPLKAAAPLPPNPLTTPRPVRAEPAAQFRPVYQPPNYAAQGGAYAALTLGLCGLALSFWRWEAAVIALVGLLAGLWGIYSPRRNLALVGMLLCALAMGLGSYRGVTDLYVFLYKDAPVVSTEDVDEFGLPIDDASEY